MRPFLLLVVAVSAASAAEGDRLESDRWFMGELNGQPAVSLHEVAVRHQDGSRTASGDMALVIVRNLDKRSARLEVRDSQSFDEDAAGAITGFRFDHEESGARSAAAGTISLDAAGAKRVVGSLHRLGRSTPIDIPVPAGVELVSERRSQELLCARDLQLGEQVPFSSLGMLQDRVLMMTSTATFKGFDDAGRRRFDVISDAVPIPVTLSLTAKGELAGMTMNLAIFKLELKPSDGPVSLLGAEIPATGLVAAVGAAPRPGPRNRYRLPAGASIAVDEFQSLDNEVLAVTSEAARSPLDDPAPFLAAEPHLEIDDPDLRKWVGDIVAGKQVMSVKEAAAAGETAAHGQDEIAEELRLAVRAYLTRDLAVGDGSALETFRSKHGDCTEHAELLCAALRIAGIPARVEIGVVYSADHKGWVGHAWNSAYVAGRWVHLDSAYPGQPRSMYIKLANGSGDAKAPSSATLLANLATLAGKPVETLDP